MSSNQNRHVNRIHDLDGLLDADLCEDLVHDVETERLTDTLPTTVAALERRLPDCIGSEDYVAVIRALVATRDPAAIRVLASLLDSVGGPIIEESFAGLLTFGRAVVPAMRECIDSLDSDMIRHAHQVLAALGDAASKQWLRHDRAECEAAYLEGLGLRPFEGDEPPSSANDPDDQKESA